MTREPPPNLRSLQARLRNEADRLDLPYARYQRSIGVAVVGELLRRAAAEEVIVIKGGSALELRFGTERSRASKDLDAMLGGRFGDYFERLQSTLRNGWAGFTGIATHPELIDVPDLAYAPHRFKVKLSYSGRSFMTVPVEISLAEGDALVEPDSLQGPDPESLGLPGVEALPCLAVEFQVAQKLHACSQPDTDSYSNDRARDLVDLQLLEHEERIRLESTAAACRSVFHLRGTHSWPIYSRAVKEVEGVPENVEEAVEQVQRLVADLDRV